jgi:transposase
LETSQLSNEEVISTYKQQGSVERGFRFLKDPLFLASSVFVKKPERIVALGFIMVLCLLVYRFAEYRLRTRLAETRQTLPNQVNKPTSTPTMRLSSSNVLRGLTSCSSSRLLVSPHSFSICCPFTNRS